MSKAKILRDGASGAIKIALWRRAIDLLDARQLLALDRWLGSVLDDPAELQAFAAHLGLEGTEYLAHLVSEGQRHRGTIRARATLLQVGEPSLN